MKSLAFVLLCAACETSRLDYPVQAGGGTGPFSSEWTPGEPTPDAGTRFDGGFGDLDGGVIGDAEGLGPDAAPQLDGGFPEPFDSAIPPFP